MLDLFQGCSWHSYHVKWWFPIQFCWGKAQQRLGGDVSWICGLKNTKANTPVYHACWVLRTQKKRLQTCSDAQPGLTRCFKRFFTSSSVLFILLQQNRLTGIACWHTAKRCMLPWRTATFTIYCIGSCHFLKLSVQKVCHPAAASISFVGTGGSGLPSGRAGLEASCISRVLSCDERKNTTVVVVDKSSIHFLWRDQKPTCTLHCFWMGDRSNKYIVLDMMTWYITVKSVLCFFLLQVTIQECRHDE